MAIGSDNIYKNLLIGGFAGAFSRSVTAPFETVKILKQNYPNSYGKNNLFSIINDIHKKNGFRALFKGNLSNCIRIIPQNAIQLAGYNYISNKLQIDNKVYNSFISGATAGMISYTAIYPLETIRSKMTVNIDSSNQSYNNVFSTLKNTYRKNGISRLYNGWQISVLGMIPYQGITFMTYNTLRDKFNQEKNNISSVIIGSIAGISAVTCTYPFDVIKRKYHLSGEMGNKKFINYRDIVKNTYNNYGIVGFYRGIFSCYAKIAPSSALFFLTAELLHKYF